jgi:hypothetical protein
VLVACGDLKALRYDKTLAGFKIRYWYLLVVIGVFFPASTKRCFAKGVVRHD